MKYIVKNKDYSYVADTELLELLLQQRGVANPQGLLNLDPSCNHDGLLFNNMKWVLE